jgi:hypothetical protein
VIVTSSCSVHLSNFRNYWRSMATSPFVWSNTPSRYKNAAVFPHSIPLRTSMAKRKAPGDALKSSPAKKRRLSTSNTPKVPTRSSALFRLPAEIRNKVYEYVLSANSGHLRFNPPPNAEFLDPYPHQYGDRISIHELSKLRYVCRQLHHETAYLEYEYNTLVFEQFERAQLEPD